MEEKPEVGVGSLVQQKVDNFGMAVDCSLGNCCIEKRNRIFISKVDIPPTSAGWCPLGLLSLRELSPNQGPAMSRFLTFDQTTSSTKFLIQRPETPPKTISVPLTY